MLARHPDALWTELDEQAVFLDAAGDRYLEANALGTFVWRLLETPQSVEDLAAAIVARYQVTREQCVADLSRFIQSLRDIGFVVDTSA